MLQLKDTIFQKPCQSLSGSFSAFFLIVRTFFLRAAAFVVYVLFFFPAMA